MRGDRVEWVNAISCYDDGEYSNDVTASSWGLDSEPKAFVESDVFEAEMLWLDGDLENANRFIR